jgi:cation:H+ antiporter
VFSVTAKVGIIALAGGTLLITPEIFTWHLPALVAINGFAAYVLLTGHLRRWHGVVLLAGYIAYWVVSFSVFGLVPVDDAPGADDEAQQPGIEAPAVPGAPDDDSPAPAIPVAPPADNDG